MSPSTDTLRTTNAVSERVLAAAVRAPSCWLSALLTMAPDTILVLGDGNGGPTPEEVFAVPALRNTPAAANRSLLVLDGPYMLGFGPRTAGAIRDLTMALYPEFLAAGE